jgi:hypothetical protein
MGLSQSETISGSQRGVWSGTDNTQDNTLAEYSANLISLDLGGISECFCRFRALENIVVLLTFPRRLSMKLTSAVEQLSKLKDLESSETNVSLVLESSQFRMESGAKVTSTPKKNAVFSLSGGGNITLLWSPVSECEFMCPLGEPKRHLEFTFTNGIRLLLTEHLRT